MQRNEPLDATLAHSRLMLAVRRAEACDWMHRTFPRKGLHRVDLEPTGAALVRAMSELAAIRGEPDALA